MEDKKFGEKEEQHQDPTLEVTELDDQALEEASGGAGEFESTTSNTNCGVCEKKPHGGQVAQTWPPSSISATTEAFAWSFITPRRSDAFPSWSRGWLQNSRTIATFACRSRRMA
jgi:hypothetical protein